MNINDSNIRPELTFRRLVFLHMQQLTNFPYIEKDFDALTDYELLCLVVKYLNDVIANSNEQNTSITNLYNAFLELQTYMNNSVQELEDAWNDKTNELEDAWNDKTTELETAFNNLQTWIDNYFDNLDVQDEINNKLDEMLEDGVLEQIIEQFLQSSAIWCFDTVASMKLATNLVNGSFAKTLGYYSINDGGMSTYKIRTKTNDDVLNEYDLISLYDENLVAEYIENEVVNIKQLGYIDTMNETTQTSFLNYVFNKYKNIVIKNEDITINNSLQVKSNQNIKMESSTIHNISTTNQTFIFQLNDVDNVNITGLNSELYFDKPDLAQQACLKIQGSTTNVSFKGINMKNAGGDGITAGSCSNISIENCTIDNSNRNGISLIGDVKGFYIKNCLLKNTSGQAPQYAIDLEPWQDDHYNEEVIIENCTFIDNTGGSIDIMPFNKNIKILNNVFNNDYINSVITMAKGENAYPKNIVIDNNEFNTSGIYLRGVQFAEYTINENKFNGGDIQTDAESDFVNFYNIAPKSGNITITNNIIKNAPNHALYFGGACNVTVSNNMIEKPFNRCINTIQCNNINILNNIFKDHAQNETDTSLIRTLQFSTTHNIKIDGNMFIDTGSTTFDALMQFDANCQKLIFVNNNALNSTYTNLMSKWGTITNEVNANNLTN